MIEEEARRLITILSNSIEKKTTIEKISPKDIKEDGKLIEITHNISLDKRGGIVDKTTFNLRKFSCGCLSDGRKNYGHVCKRCGRICCSRHSYRCIRCRKALCIYCLEAIDGIVYCKGWCSFVAKMKHWFRTK